MSPYGEAGMAYAVVDKRGREVYPYRRELLSTIIGRAEDHAQWLGDDVFVVDEQGHTVHHVRVD